ncbi:sulfur carrier protein ThiS [Saccharibacillus sp. JS10]|uniref:sulfur carrier protein ThiS n=1 Tax=Saccharibacillus sp. JS10 TaxID=2950552 RepID=UPI00210C2C30|nr:sulfur carrier protein ThiS [Saccharibacillus sp. JS10]MCQ4087856.1 sulfur carrier protein ThiS [Saccharibacillus sp. JS10]
MVELIINGTVRQLDAATLTEVVEQLGLNNRPIIAEINGEVVLSEHWQQTEVADGMKIEFVHFVGGG